MQTQQVTNPANVLSTPSPSSKQADSKSSESFGNVLSREVADRQSQAEPAKAQDTTKQPAAAETRPAKSGATESKSKDKTDAADATDKSTESAAQASDDLLALVATLSKVVAPATDKAETDSKSEAKDDTAAIDPALALAAGAAAVNAAPVAAQPTTSTQPVEAGTQRKPSADTSGVAELSGSDKQALDAAAVAKADVPAATASVADLAAKGQELLNGGSKQSATPDFAAAVKDSTAALTNAMQPMQAMQHAAIQAAPAHTVDKLTPAVGTPAWDQALGQKVVWMVAGEQQSASLTLNPPDLGPLQVVLSVTNSHASATFTAAQPEVRQALEAAMPKLRDMLGDAGIQLGQATVNSGSANQQGAPDQQASQTRRAFEGDNRNDNAAQPIRVGRVQPASSGQGLVDTFV